MEKLVFITANMPFGRGEEFLIEELCALHRIGVPFTIFPRSYSSELVNSDAHELAERAVRTPPVSLRGVVSLLHYAWQEPARLTKVFGTILNQSGGIANTLRNLAVLPKAAELASRLPDMPDVHLHAYWASTVATIAYAAAELKGVTWSFSCHRGDIKRGNMLGTKLRSARFVRAISGQAKEWLLKRTGSNQDNKVHVLHLGVRCGEPSIEVTTAAPSSLVFVTPASLLPVKGHAYLLGACRLLIEGSFSFRLILYGDGPLRNSLLRSIQELRLDKHVSMLGRIDHLDLLRLYAAGHVGCVVLPSITTPGGDFEGIPVSLMEAMAHSIPVITTGSGAIRELVDDATGIVVPEKDAEALASAMVQVLKGADLRHKLGSRGLARVSSQYDSNKNAKRLLELITSQLTTESASDLTTRCSA